MIGPDPDAGGPLTHGAQRTTYNDWGQPTQVEFGTVSSYTNWAGFTQIDRQTVTYDGAGRMTHARLIEGSATHALMQYSYDSAGRVDCVAQRMNPSTFASPPGSACTAATAGTYGPDRITRTTYDELNRRADVTTAYGTSTAITEAAWTYTENGQVETLTDGEGNMYTYEYDAFDRLYRRRYPSPTSVGNSSTSDYEQFTYDAYGRLDTRRTRSGGTFSYDYDGLNRVTEVTAPGGMPTTTYTYDNHGRILTVSAGSDTITNTYNGRGWLASQTSAGRTVEYTYDVLGRRTRLDWPDSYYVTYTYTQGGQLSSIREEGATSGAGRLADFTYDQHGRRILLERGNDVDTDYAYDAASRLEELVHDLNGTSHDRTLDFSYNPAGQITSRTDSNTSYAWTDFANGTEDLTYDGLNRILSVTSQMATPDYDDRGNLIQDHNNQTYGYDEYNRLTSVGSTIELAYDPFGRLAETSGMGVTFREFLYDGVNLIAEYDVSGTLQRRYVHGPGTDEPLVEYTSASTSSRTWLIADERGSIVAITDGSGNATQVNTYDEYGDPGSSNAGRFGYTGQMWLPETGLYHYKARAYNPELGRFMQTDPIGVNGGMNIYAYVGGDPVNATDPLGLIETHTISCTNYWTVCGGFGWDFGGGSVAPLEDGRPAGARGSYGSDGGAGRPRGAPDSDSDTNCLDGGVYYGEPIEGIAGVQVGTMGGGPTEWLATMIQNGMATTISNASQTANREVAWSFYAPTSGSSLSGGWAPSTPVFIGQPEFHGQSASSPTRTSYPRSGNVRVGIGHSHGAFEPLGIQGPSGQDQGWQQPQVIIDDDLSTWTRGAGPGVPIVRSNLTVAGVICVAD